MWVSLRSGSPWGHTRSCPLTHTLHRLLPSSWTSIFKKKEKKQKKKNLNIHLDLIYDFTCKCFDHIDHIF